MVLEEAAAADSNICFQPDSNFTDCSKIMVPASACEQLEPHEKLIITGTESVESKACIVGMQDNKYVCETHGKKFSSRQYMNVHLTNSGMEPLPKLKRGRKSVADANASLQDGENRVFEDHLIENNADPQKKKGRHLMTPEGEMAIISASKRGRKTSTALLLSEGSRQDCVVEQYDDGYVCETHGLKYSSRHTINVHLMHCGMEPLPKLKRGRKSSTAPSEGTRRYEPSRSHELAIAVGGDMNDQSCSRSSAGLSNCMSLPERLDTGMEGVSGHLKLQVV